MIQYHICNCPDYRHRAELLVSIINYMRPMNYLATVPTNNRDAAMERHSSVSIKDLLHYNSCTINRLSGCQMLTFWLLANQTLSTTVTMIQE